MKTGTLLMIREAPVFIGLQMDHIIERTISAVMGCVLCALLRWAWRQKNSYNRYEKLKLLIFIVHAISVVVNEFWSLF